MVNGTIVIYNIDKKEYEMFSVDVIELTDAQIGDVKTGQSKLNLEMYQTEDAYKAKRFKFSPPATTT